LFIGGKDEEVREMKRYLLPLMLMAAVLLAVSGFTINDDEPALTSNCFFGKVLDRFHQPVAGVTVRLICPDGSQYEAQTDNNGMYRICAPGGGCGPGWYLVVTGCCEKRVLYSGHGNIRVDFVIPCTCR
jgi:hypothetical protein